jgi:hypothetical protein
MSCACHCVKKFAIELTMKILYFQKVEASPMLQRKKLSPKPRFSFKMEYIGSLPDNKEGSLKSALSAT